MDVPSAILTLFLIMDPLGNIPLFLAALKTVRPERRRLVLVREIAIAYLVLVAAVLAFGLFKRMSTTYLVSTQRLYIRRGMLSKREQQTRIDRVQNVNTEQSLRERMLGVGTVDFDTAGTDDSEFKFVGIASPREVVNAVDRAQRDA